jgi:LysR family transcriptional regulator, nitrogen assimilation regulatory protein
LEIKQLRTFLAVAAYGSVSRAAEKLHIVQPALSRQIQMLEDDLGTPLFQRVGHGMQLTDAGHLLVIRAKRALEELEQARIEITLSPESIKGTVIVGLLPSVSDLLAGKLLLSLKEKYPNLSIRILVGYVGYLQDWLVKDEVDIALLYAHKPAPSIEITPILNEKLYVVGPPNADLHLNRAKPLRDLKKYSFVMPTHPHGLRTLLDHACAVSGIELDIVAETNSMNTQKCLAQANIGYTILPGLVVFEDVKMHKLSASPITDPEIIRQISMALSVTRKPSLAVRTVMEQLKQIINDSIKQNCWPGASLID